MPIILRKVLLIVIIISLVYGVYWLIDKNNTFDKEEEIVAVETGIVVSSSSGTNVDWETSPLGGYPEIFEEESGTGTITTGDSQEPLLEKDTVVDNDPEEPEVTTGKTTTTPKTTTKKPAPKTSSPDNLLGELFN